MTKLTELEKEKVIACVGYYAKKFECDRYKLELDYDKFGRYDGKCEEAIEQLKKMEEFYSNLGKKLKEVL